MTVMAVHRCERFSRAAAASAMPDTMSSHSRSVTFG
jgi:hypothetical protein